VGRPVRLAGDRALASRIAGGESAAFDEMFRRYHQPIYRFCSAMVGPDEAEDLLQNVMAKAMISLPDDEDFQMKPWLYRVARNECVDHLRRSSKTNSGLDGDRFSDDSARSDPSQVAVQRERLRWLVDDLNELPDKQRAALLMRELSGLSFAEIASSVGSSEAAAKQLVYEARVSLEQADLGRKLDCAEVRKSISSHDRRRLRARKVRSHMRTCRGCSDFERAISDRQAGFQSLFPAMPLGAAAGLLDAIHGGGIAAGVTGAGSAATATGGALTGGVASGIIAKGAVMLAVAGGIGVGTAEVARQHGETRSTVKSPATKPYDPASVGKSATAFGSDPATGPLTGPAFKAAGGTKSVEVSDHRPDRGNSQREANARGEDHQPDGSGSTSGRVTPGPGGGHGPASLPQSSAQGQARAQAASGSNPGQRGGSPPSSRPATPPGQASAQGSPAGTSESTKASQGNSGSAPALGRAESPGKSGK
jgi:RNA polymerase sigma factor (sigma-70 family)